MIQRDPRAAARARAMADGYPSDLINSYVGKGSTENLDFSELEEQVAQEVPQMEFVETFKNSLIPQLIFDYRWERQGQRVQRYTPGSRIEGPACAKALYFALDGDVELIEVFRKYAPKTLPELANHICSNAQWATSIGDLHRGLRFGARSLFTNIVHAHLQMQAFDTALIDLAADLDRAERLNDNHNDVSYMDQLKEVYGPVVNQLLAVDCEETQKIARYAAKRFGMLTSSPNL